MYPYRCTYKDPRISDLKVPHPPKTLVLKPYTYIPESALTDS